LTFATDYLLKKKKTQLFFSYLAVSHTFDTSLASEIMGILAFVVQGHILFWGERIQIQSQ
jgi:hypothetical protein